jgi:hypothetical protein
MSINLMPIIDNSGEFEIEIENITNKSSCVISITDYDKIFL